MKISERLSRINQQLAEISSQSRFSKRIEVESGDEDELSLMVKEINILLDVIEASHTQLELHARSQILALNKASADLRQQMSDHLALQDKLKLSEKRLEYLAHYDPSTGLPNETLFQQLLREYVADAHEQHYPLSVLILGIDQFSEIHEAYKHVYDEEIIKQLVLRIKTQLTDKMVILARVSESEFGLLLKEVDHAHTEATAQQLLKAIHEPLEVLSQELYFTGSIGVCFYPNDAKTAEELERNAAIAMYRVKNSGGNAVKYYSSEMSLHALRRVELEGRLRRAIAKHHFVMVYQPKYDLNTQKIVGFEALVRWQDPEQGIISPNEFIPLAEETGLILPLGEWTIRRVCQTAQEWQAAGLNLVPIAVNLSPVQFADNKIVETIAQALHSSGLDARYLELELTESAVIKDADVAEVKLNQLHELGIQFAIDDFGTGYSSMSYLKRFPIHYLKIDRSFVFDLIDNRDSKAIVNAVIVLAHSLGLKVVAEGIETVEQLEYLRKQGCDFGQGYLFSRPVNQEKAMEMLRA